MEYTCWEFRDWDLTWQTSWWVLWEMDGSTWSVHWYRLPQMWWTGVLSVTKISEEISSFNPWVSLNANGNIRRDRCRWTVEGVRVDCAADSVGEIFCWTGKYIILERCQNSKRIAWFIPSEFWESVFLRCADSTFRRYTVPYSLVFKLSFEFWVAGLCARFES